MSEIKCPKCGEVFTVDESGYAAIVGQVRDSEFQKELESREKAIALQKKVELELVKANADKDKDKAMLELKAEIEKLKGQISLSEQGKALAINEAVAKQKDQMHEKEKEIFELKSQVREISKDEQIKEKTLKDKYEVQLKMKDETIEFYKDLKTRMSTKMVGETLEQHCEIEFNKLRSTGFQNAYFEKDNDARTGSKGDYIFRDYTNGDNIEFISIMFEMKNEMETTATKKRNEDFLKELDKDRNEKGCEYAILVSLLEPENELYNSGIVDMSHKYPKMYVIRPQFFIPMITLLRNSSMSSIAYRKQVAEYKEQNIDVTNFESDLLAFQSTIGKNYELAHKKFKSAISEIDNAILRLQKVKSELEGSEKNLRIADDKASDLSVKKLTKNNPTMKKMFDDINGENNED